MSAHHTYDGPCTVRHLPMGVSGDDGAEYQIEAGRIARREAARRSKDAAARARRARAGLKAPTYLLGPRVMPTDGSGSKFGGRHNPPRGA